MTSRFDVASPEEIRSGRVADVSLERGRDALRAEREDPHVVAEVRAATLPGGWGWGVLAGLGEALNLLEDRNVEVQAVEEGSAFYAEEPVMVISGRYLEFAVLETALLGLLCQASGIATAAARCKLAADGRPVFSLGARRMHPAIAPMIERASFIGGCDGVTTVKGAEVAEARAVGTLPTTAALILGEERAWKAFDRVLERKVPRVILVDAVQDAKFGALAAAETLRDRLAVVRLDPPPSRRDGLTAVLREVRWELDARGFSNVQIFVSGGVDERRILGLNRYADVYGVGTAISNAPVIEFALDVVEIEGRPRARRGKLSGRKNLWACPECGNRGIAPASARLGHCPRCGHRVRALLDTWIADGRRRRKSPRPREVRQFCMDQIAAAPDPFGRRE